MNLTQNMRVACVVNISSIIIIIIIIIIMITDD